MGEARRKNQLGIVTSSQKPANVTPVIDNVGILTAIKGKTVISFVEDSYTCCTEKMIIEYTPFLQLDGFAPLVVPTVNFQDVLKYLSQYAVFFRTACQSQPPGLITSVCNYIQHLKSVGVRCVYYLDDFLMHSNSNAPLALMQACDLVIVSNEILKDYLENKCSIQVPITVVPTHINLSTFDHIPYIENTSDRFKVLFSSQGRIGINHIYEICEIANEKPELAKRIEWIFNSHEVAQIRSIINKFRNLKKIYIDWLPLQSFYTLCKSVDLICHPSRPEDLSYMVQPEFRQVWLDSKSEVKYTIAGAARLPIIATPTFSYKKAIKQGETGFLADTSEEFVERIDFLQQNPDVCDQIGENARKDVEENYDIKKRYPKYLSALMGTEVQLSLTNITITSKLLYLPPIEGGPRSFYENMKRYLPIVSGGKWAVTDRLELANTAIAVAFIGAEEIIKEKEKRGLRIIYRLDGLPMKFESDILEPTHLKLMQEMFRKADVMVWQSRHCLNMWKDKGLVPVEIDPSGPIIHNGVDTTIFKPEGDIYPIPTDKYNILHVNWSTFTHKRIDLLQKIVKLAKEKAPNVHFYMLGNYMSVSPLISMEVWKDDPNVTYMGAMRNQGLQAKNTLASAYRAAKAVIFTSEMEGSPNTCLEAVACGVPILYNAAVDIVPEICGDQCVGWKTPEEFIEKYKIAIRPTLRDEFTVENCVKKYLEVL